jgi:predicted small secreted protein
MKKTHLIAAVVAMAVLLGTACAPEPTVCRDYRHTANIIRSVPQPTPAPSPQPVVPRYQPPVRERTSLTIEQVTETRVLERTIIP